MEVIKTEDIYYCSGCKQKIDVGSEMLVDNGVIDRYLCKGCIRAAAGGDTKCIFIKFLREIESRQSKMVE